MVDSSKLEEVIIESSFTEKRQGAGCGSRAWRASKMHNSFGLRYNDAKNIVAL